MGDAPLPGLKLALCQQYYSSNYLSETREKLEALLNTRNFELSECDEVLARKSDMLVGGCCMCGNSQTKDTGLSFYRFPNESTNPECVVARV